MSPQHQIQGLQQQAEELRQQVAELLAWKASVEAVWPQIVENLDGTD